uniref:Uncharacterized protein n=1 Tax=Strombidinopsis acuminata TaxID=141414 RepID=A0A7S3TFF3_9SPIT|mmetsp:Transcript_64162/g.88757  ORF Transcript_64162/g.88757 Transcript_64162/m.88757 type:complete len:354 (+) Transcript_64162:3-1064(+)
MMHPCSTWPVRCLSLDLPTLTGPMRERAQALASAWGGSIDTKGLCNSSRRLLATSPTATRLTAHVDVEEGTGLASVRQALGSRRLQDALRQSTLDVLSAASPAITGALVLDDVVTTEAAANRTGNLVAPDKTGTTMQWWVWMLLGMVIGGVLFVAAAAALRCFRPAKKAAPRENAAFDMDLEKMEETDLPAAPRLLGSTTPPLAAQRPKESKKVGPPFIPLVPLRVARPADDEGAPVTPPASARGPESARTLSPAGRQQARLSPRLEAPQQRAERERSAWHRSLNDTPASPSMAASATAALEMTAPTQARTDEHDSAEMSEVSLESEPEMPPLHRRGGRSPSPKASTLMYAHV